MITYWAAVLAISILLYVVLDGFDLGVGMLFGTTSDEDHRQSMLSSISPVWDGNETWLVVAGVTLWGAFPPVYAAALSAFYIPVSLMLVGLIFRGVSFEFRSHAHRSRWVWTLGLFFGSLCAAFMQGAMVGSLVEGLPVVNGRFAGDAMTWLSPFSVLCGISLCFGYTLLGAGWVARKCVGKARSKALSLAPRLAGITLILVFILFAHALISNLRIMDRWIDRPILFVVPVIAAAAYWVILSGCKRDNDRSPFNGTVLLFICAYAMFAISFWPYMIPFSITLQEAASPTSSLRFMFWGAGLVVFPLMLIYTACSYWVFKGKSVIHHH
ncbi:cytochrome d ubiquinol oxidase subunit II [Pseudomonas sp. PP3]|uniref:cytochrome d ubiquinol oxidase subunit II n=1 Tax=Pseudomonas sp. PP3 TaxID=2815936 RepID=UPI001BAF8593|nr:cytochrome d ubiquinol oxidase subunit II [Pseudomonas sp. PP3]